MPRPKGKTQASRGHRGTLKEAWAEGNYSQQEQHSDDGSDAEEDALNVRSAPAIRLVIMTCPLVRPSSTT